MNKILLSLALLALMSFTALAQPWLKNMPSTKSKNDYSLFDYKEAFDAYWEPFNVNNKGKYLKDGVEVKAAGWKQFNRWYYNLEAQVDPTTGKFPDKTAQQCYNEYLKNYPSSKSTLQDNWTGIGPNSSSGGYAGIGRINCIAFHPTDNNTYWVGAPAGGLWKTTNNGTSWTCLTDDNAVLGVSDIIIPTDYATSNTIYIATGDRDASDNYSVGVLKSTDGGLTWNTTGLSYTLSQYKMVNRLLLDPSSNSTIIAATSSGVYKTTNGGTTWSTQLTSSAFIDMEYKPGTFSTLYGSTESGSIYTSVNSGSSWTQSFTSSSAYRIELAVTANNSSVVYAVAAGFDDGLYGVYKSSNSGTSFTQTYSGTSSNLMGWYSDGSDSGGQGWYDLSIAVSPTDASKVIVGGVISHRSTDGGVSWSCSNCWTSYYLYNVGSHPVVHADKHNLTYRSNGDLFECNDGGIYLSTNDGSTWTDKSDGLVNSQMYKLGVSQSTAGEIITGLQDNGTKLYSGGIWYDVKGGDGMECLIDYTDDNVQYGTYVYGQISRTLNQWNSDTDIEPLSAGDGAWVTPFIIDPITSTTIYAGYADVWKTTDRGDNWTKISTINLSDKIRSMAIAPSNTNVLYVAGRSAIYTTTNGGTSWSNVTGTLPTGSGYLTSIAVKNNDENTVWVTLGGYNTYAVYESTNGGSTWTNISTGLPSLPAYSVVQNKQSISETQLYVGTELGVYFKSGNNNWVEYNTSLPNVKIGELEIYYATDPANSRLRAATYGRGLWETPIEVPVANTQNITNVSTLKANGSYKTGESIQIDVTFSAAVDVDITGGKPRIKLNTSPVKYAVYSGNTQTGLTSLPFVYTVGSIENSAALDYTSVSDLTLEGSTIQESGVNADLKLPSVGTFASNHNIVIDNQLPAVTISSEISATNASSFEVAILFSEVVTGFSIDDIKVNNGVKNNLKTVVDNKEFSVEISPSLDGQVAVSIESGVVIDLADNLNLASNVLIVNIDATAPNFKSVEIATIAEAFVELKIIMDEAASVYYALLHNGASAPTNDQLINGTTPDAILMGAIEFLADQAELLSLESLDPNTDYTVYLVAVDNIENESMMEEVDFKTNSVSVNSNEMWGLNLYPNPSAGVFFVEFSDESVIGNEMSIVSADGKIIAKFPIVEMKQKVELSNLSTGNYLILIEANTGSQTYQFAIE